MNKIISTNNPFSAATQFNTFAVSSFDISKKEKLSYMPWQAQRFILNRDNALVWNGQNHGEQEYLIMSKFLALKTLSGKDWLLYVSNSALVRDMFKMTVAGHKLDGFR